MKWICISIMLCTVMPSVAQNSIPVMQTGGSTMPDEWIDASTHHLIVKLSRRAGHDRSFYFHNYPFIQTPDGKG